LSYTESTEQPAIDVVTLISNIGGSLGLLLGICCVSLVEAFELTLKTLLVFLKHKKKQRKVQNHNKVIDVLPANNKA
jgi:hypothetical protein